MKRNRDKLLGVAAMMTFILAAANALEYFFAGLSYLKRRTGVVSYYNHENYTGRRGMLYSKTTIRLKDVDADFYLSDRTSEGGYIETAEGETITIYARQPWQYFYNFNFSSNIYYVSKNGRGLYNNTGEWMASAFAFMCFFGGCALLLFVIYLDVVKNISIENWFQKRILKNPNYISKRRRNARGFNKEILDVEGSATKGHHMNGNNKSEETRHRK